MSLYCIGLDHRSSSIELLERLHVLGRIDAPVAARRINAPCTPSAVAVLATCNRVEVYAVFDVQGKDLSPADAYRWLAEFVSRGSGVSEVAFSPHLLRNQGTDAIRHLCRVASGLESAIIGEPEILGQVTAAMRAIDGKAPLLPDVFHAAVRAGRRARNETTIGRGAASFTSAVANLAEASRSREELPTIAVAGIGKVGAGAVRVLRKRGRSKVIVLNRSPAAVGGERDHPISALPLTELPDTLLKVDAVVLATSARRTILPRAHAARAMRARGGRPLTVIDVGVPRNADPSVGDLNGVHLVNVDDIGRQVEGAIERRGEAIPVVEEIIDKEINRFLLNDVRREAA